MIIPAAVAGALIFLGIKYLANIGKSAQDHCQNPHRPLNEKSLAIEVPGSIIGAIASGLKENWRNAKPQPIPVKRAEAEQLAKQYPEAGAGLIALLVQNHYQVKLIEAQTFLIHGYDLNYPQAQEIIDDQLKKSYLIKDQDNNLFISPQYTTGNRPHKVK